MNLVVQQPADLSLPMGGLATPEQLLDELQTQAYHLLRERLPFTTRQQAAQLKQYCDELAEYGQPLALSDFLVRSLMGQWAEARAIDSLSRAYPHMTFVHYGASHAGNQPGFTAEQQDANNRHYDSTKEHGKRPDILGFLAEDYQMLQQQYGTLVRSYSNDDTPVDVLEHLDELSDTDERLTDILRYAQIAIEVECTNRHIGNSNYPFADKGYFGVNQAKEAEQQESLRQRICQQRPDLSAQEVQQLVLSYLPYEPMSLAQQAKYPKTYLKVADHQELVRWQQQTADNDRPIPLMTLHFYHDAAYLFDWQQFTPALQDGVIGVRDHSYQEGNKLLWEIPASFATELLQETMPRFMAIPYTDTRRIGAQTCHVLYGGSWTIPDQTPLPPRT